MNNENLKTPSHEQAVERGRKGGKRSVEVRRERKILKEYMNIILSLPEQDPDRKALLDSLSINEEDKNIAMSLVLTIFEKAIQGDLRSATYIRNLVEGKPSNRIKSRVDLNSSRSEVIIYKP